MNQPLTNGSQVCIIGGGPAGSFAARHLLKLARERNLDLQVRIFEPRDFGRPGPAGCNRCAGILSSRLVRGLQTLALQLPEEVIQSGLRAYAVHLDGETIRIEQPDPGRSILSVYRGGPTPLWIAAARRRFPSRCQSGDLSPQSKAGTRPRNPKGSYEPHPSSQPGPRAPDPFADHLPRRRPHADCGQS